MHPPFCVCTALRALALTLAVTRSRLREIEQLEAQAKRLAELRIAPAAADDAGLEDLTEEQLQLVADALGPGPPQLLATRSFKGARCSACMRGTSLTKLAFVRL